MVSRRAGTAKGRGGVGIALAFSGSQSGNADGSGAVNRKMTVIKTVDKSGREVFTYLRSTPPPEQKAEGRKRRNESIRITLKLPQ